MRFQQRCLVLFGISIVVGLFITINSACPQTVDTLWTARYDTGDNYPSGFAVDLNENVYIALPNMIIIYDTNGVLIGDFDSIIEANDLSIDDNGYIYIIGVDNDDLVTIKFNSDGDTSWVKSYNGIGDGWDNANDIAVDSHGNVYVCGSSENQNNESDIVLIKYLPDGTEEWANIFDGPNGGYDSARALAIDDSDNICVVGYVKAINDADDYVTLKYYPNGDTAWARYYNGPADDDDGARALAIDDLGNIYVTGNSDGVGTFEDITTIKYDDLGNQIWVSRYNGTGDGDDDKPFIKVDDTYNVIIAGRSSGISTGKDLVTIKYNSSGDTVWVRRYDGPANAFDEVEDLTLDIAGNIYITGDIETPPEDDKDFITIRYSDEGELDWMAFYNGPIAGDDEGRFIALGNSGNVIVTGQSFGLNGYDCLTIKYRQSQTIINDSNSHNDYSNFMVYQNFPNPFNALTTVTFSTFKPQQVKLIVYDLLGREVIILQNEYKPAGFHRINFDASDLASGVYLYCLQAGQLLDTKRLVIIK